MGEEGTNRDAACRVDSEFRAKISYEIRTTVNSILGTANLMLDTNLSSEQAQYLQTIKSSAEHLMTTVNELLTPDSGF